MKHRNSKPLKVCIREQLEKMHTRQLLARKRFFYRFWDEDGVFTPTRDGYFRGSYEDHILYHGTAGDAERERAWINEILASREHVQNKEESRNARKERKKTGEKRKSRKKGD